METKTLGIPAKDLQRFSFGKFFRELGQGKKLTGLEREVNDQAAFKFGREATGAWLPWEVLDAKRDLLVSGTGSSIRPTPLAGDYSSALYNRSLLVELGAKILSGLQYPLQIPRVSGGPAITAHTEGAAISASTVTLDAQLDLSPVLIEGRVRLSSLLNVQSPLFGAMAVQQLLASVDQEVQRQVFIGSGSGGEMTGLVGQSIGEPIETQAAGFAPTTTVLRSLEAEVATNDALLDDFAFVCSNDTMEKMKATETGGSGLPDWQSNPDWPAYKGAVDGRRAYASNVLPLTTSGTLTDTASYCIAGSFSDLVLGLYGPGPDIIMNPVTDVGWQNISAHVLANSGAQRPTCFAFTDNLNNAA